LTPPPALRILPTALITAVLTELLKYMQKSRDCWFTTHEALADWAQAGRRRAHFPEPLLLRHDPSTVIADAAVSAFTRVFDALWRRSAIQMRTPNCGLDSRFVSFTRAPE
jgi:hypothetical protein